MLGLLGMAAANGATLLAAHEILRRLRTGAPGLDLVLFLLLRFLLVSATTLLALATGLFTSSAMGIFGAVALAALLATGAHRRLPRIRLPEMDPFVLVAAALVLVRLLVQVWIFAPVVPDVLAYHLPKVGEWIVHGRMTGETGPDPRSNFPAGFELVEAWWCVFLHHDALLEMAGVEFLALGAAAAYALARWVDLGPRPAAFAALLTILTPGLHLQATSCINDGAAAALMLAVAALLVHRAPPGLLLLAAGLAMGVKPTFVYFAPGLLLLGWMVRTEPRAPSPFPRGIAAVAVAGLAVGGFWYAQNLVRHGNPVHPMGMQGIRDANGEITLPSHPGVDRLKDNFVKLADRRLMDRVSAPGAMTPNGAGWGAAVVACGLAALILQWRESRRLRLLTTAFLVSMAAVFASVLPDPWFLRFALFFPVIPAIAAARLAAEHRPVYWLAAAAAGLCFLSTTIPVEMPVAGVGDMVRQPWRSRVSIPLAGLPAPGRPIASVDSNKANFYLVYGPDFSHRILFPRVAGARELREVLRRESIRDVHGTRASAVIQEALEQGWLRKGVGPFYEVVPDP